MKPTKRSYLKPQDLPAGYRRHLMRKLDPGQKSALSLEEAWLRISALAERPVYIGGDARWFVFGVPL